ncbi:MAG: hypothetical protein K2W85_15570 [Phycisphaerales bacterium]|nr:hypothetical protein [Phycisphaerales bacterium]
MPLSPPSQVGAKDELQPAAALLAIAFPGLGHFYLGHIHRGACICAGIMGMFLTGLLIGGISCVDRRENFIWFMGQALVGPPTFIVDALHQNRFKVRDMQTIRSARPDEAKDPDTGSPTPIFMDNGVPSARTAKGQIIAPAYPPYVKSLGRTGELGTLFITIAGFMNVIVVVDAAFNVRAPRRRTQPTSSGARTLKIPGTESVGGAS